MDYKDMEINDLIKLISDYLWESCRLINVAINAKEYTYEVRVQARDKARELDKERDKIMLYLKGLAKEEAR